jgi:ribosomal protein S18 acetylase RimI-like enzyme
VQVSNEDAVRFYSRHGFEVGETVPGYYGRRMDPPDALVLRRRLVQQQGEGGG